jgi:FkbM family methyltransferase
VKGGAAFDANTRCDWWTEPGAVICGLVTASIEWGGLTFQIQPNESHLLEDTREEIAKYTGPLNVVVDIGAHAGTFALQCAQRGAYVYAVEPSPLNLMILRRNVAGNELGHKVKIIERAAAVESDTLVPLRMGSPFPGQRSLAFKGSKLSECDVETVSLSDLLSPILLEHGSVDYMKMDIEGGEYAIAGGPVVPELAGCRYISISLHLPSNKEYFDFSDGRTDDQYHSDMIGWMKRSGVANARIEGSMAIGTN